MKNEFDLGPIMCSQGGFAYNGNHIEYWKARAMAAEARSTPAQGGVTPGVIERMVTGAMETSRHEAIEECAKIAENNGWEATAAQIRALSTVTSTQHQSGDPQP